MIKCLIIVFSQEIVLPNMLTLTLMFDILIKRLRDVLTWSMKKRRESGKPSIIPASTLGNKVLQKGIDIGYIGFCKRGRYCQHWYLQKGYMLDTLFFCKKRRYRFLWHQIRSDNIHFRLKENSRQLGRSFPTQEGGTLHAPECKFFSAFKVEQVQSE